MILYFHFFSDLRRLDFDVAVVLDNIDFEVEGIHITVFNHLRQPNGYDTTDHIDTTGILKTGGFLAKLLWIILLA